MKTALITGIKGQDGSYLAEFLLSKNYRVIGTMRDPEVDSDCVLAPGTIEVIGANLFDQGSFEHVLRKFAPDEFYNLAGRTFGTKLWTDPVLTGEINGLAVTRILEAIRKVSPKTRLCQASSSEVFGNANNEPQTEVTPFRPRNPYGAAKAYAHWIVQNYRQVHNLFACSSILFNHESPRRGPDFVTRKITVGVAKIKLGLESELRLGSLDARRDWGFAGDYVRAMWLMLQHATPDDYVIATGETHTVREFCDLAFASVGLDYRDYVQVDRANFRLPETTLLVGNPTKAKRLLGWVPTLSFPDLVQMMVAADLMSIQKMQQSAPSGVTI